MSYPLAGWLITVSGPMVTFAILSVLAGVGVVCGMLLWPQESGEPVTHSHNDLPKDHPHVQDGRTHSHPIVIDDYHPHWPRVRELGRHSER